MSIKKLFRDIRAAIRNSERPLTERLFIALTIVSEIVVTIALIGDIVTGEEIREIIVLIITLIAVPTITFTGMYRNKVKIGIRLVVVGLLFAILPTLFFFGGGIYGGGVLWIIFAFMYVGLVMEGVERTIFLVLLFVLAGGCYLVYLG